MRISDWSSDVCSSYLHIGIGLAYGVRNGAVLDVAPIYIKVLPVGAAARIGGARGDALQGDQAVFVRDVQALFNKFRAQTVANSLPDIACPPVPLRRTPNRVR